MQRNPVAAGPDAAAHRALRIPGEDMEVDGDVDPLEVGNDCAVEGDHATARRFAVGLGRCVGNLDAELAYFSQMTLPSTTVITASASIGSMAGSNISRSKMLKSASLPTSIEPRSSSWKAA